MTTKQQSKLKVTAAALCLFALVALGLTANAAREEVYYLCGNFKEGISYASVVRQLDTANLSGYQVESLANGNLIRFSSPLNFHYFRCTISFNSSGSVVAANYR